MAIIQQMFCGRVLNCPSNVRGENTANDEESNRVDMVQGSNESKYSIQGSVG